MEGSRTYTYRRVEFNEGVVTLNPPERLGLSICSAQRQIQVRLYQVMMLKKNKLSDNVNANQHKENCRACKKAGLSNKKQDNSINNDNFLTH